MKWINILGMTRLTAKQTDENEKLSKRQGQICCSEFQNLIITMFRLSGLPSDLRSFHWNGNSVEVR